MFSIDHVFARITSRRSALLIALMTFLQVHTTYAMPGTGRFAQRDGHRPGYNQPGPRFQREAPPQFQRRDQRPPGDSPRGQRLSPEERRQLRRDIHDAGRDIYPARQ